MPAVAIADTYWTLPRTAGVIIVGSAALLAVVSIIFSIRGDVRATEAMFRDIDVAIGNTTTLRVMSLSWGAWSIAVLAGFVVLAVEFWNRGSMLIPTLAVVGLTVFTVAWVIEAAFHSSVTIWAVGQLEQGAEFPVLFHELKRWLNLWLQVACEPPRSALVYRNGCCWDAHRRGSVMGWMGIIIWSGLFVFFPLPLAIAPVALFFGVVLLGNA